jgi:hypothetical protein
MVQPAPYRHGDEFAFAAEDLLHWRLPAQSLMRARRMVILREVLPEQPFQVSLVQRDDTGLD